MKPRIRRLIFDTVEITLIGIGVFAAINFFLAQPVQVSGVSMAPTLEDKDSLLIEKVSIKYDQLKRGQIIVFKEPQNPKKYAIKRIIGLPNEKLTVSEGKVLVNGIPLAEDYLSENTQTQAGTYLAEGVEVTISPSSYLVMGDNRSQSVDSRTWGEINQNSILGKLALRFYPFKTWKTF